ncbi:carrier superfamily protein [Cardiosporidium cionae]|uniref:Carrier superfamily protein n=1 Tax=Cardiosporidium cionae TaxID=476202 RepID=A0ABQ7JAU5_9APIC|nr:carrier superfamily protein [Cardiosporidium cionae]|eukprot:KAF8821101.1 carrier superfamily protein [Cardiosporidium cionae]
MKILTEEDPERVGTTKDISALSLPSSPLANAGGRNNFVSSSKDETSSTNHTSNPLSTPTMPHSNKFIYAASAGFSAIVTKTACAPWDRIRFLFQVQSMFSQPITLDNVNSQTRADGSSSQIVIKPKANVISGISMDMDGNIAKPPSESLSAQRIVPKYNSVWHAIRTIVHEEGLQGLWRGNYANICRATMVYMLKFGTNDYIKQSMALKQSEQDPKYTINMDTQRSTGRNVVSPPRNVLQAHSNSKNPIGESTTVANYNRSEMSAENLRLSELLLAGTTAGCVQKFGSYPMDLLSVRIALGINTATLGKSKYSGIIDCMRSIWINEGVGGFYKGFVPTLLTGIPYVALQMTLFEVYRRKLTQFYRQLTYGNSALIIQERTPNRSMTEVFLSSGFSGCLASLTAQSIVFPGDTVRKRMMSNGVNGSRRHYRNSWDCFLKILRHEGFASFYYGIWPACLRSIPSGAIQFGCYEFIKTLLLRIT